MRKPKKPVIQHVVCDYHKKHPRQRGAKAGCTCMSMYKLEVRDEERRR